MAKKARRKLSVKQWNWIRSFELEFGFEVIGLDQFIIGEEDWDDLVRYNCQWIEDNTGERLEKLRASAEL